MQQKKYADDKPRSCEYCFFWEKKKKDCILRKENCYYLISIPPKKKNDCDDCPYGRNKPCIGWCTKRILDK